jgi:hypothetical protein
MNKQKDSEKKSGMRINIKSKLFWAQASLLTILIAATTLAGTYAYLLLNTAPVANDFTFGIPRVTIVEPSVTPTAVVWGANTKPVFLSIPSDAIGGAVRAAIIPMLKDASGNIVSTPTGPLAAPVANAIVMGDITLHFASGWNTNWFYRDGFFYYKKVLNTGETTTQLLSGVTLTSNTPAMVAKYQNIVVQIEVMSDVLQPNQDALTLWGVTVDGSGNVS